MIFHRRFGTIFWVFYLWKMRFGKLIDQKFFSSLICVDSCWFSASMVCKRWRQRKLNIFRLEVFDAVANHSRLSWPQIITTLLKKLPMVEILILPREYDPTKEATAIQSLQFLTQLICSVEHSLNWVISCSRLVSLCIEVNRDNYYQKISTHILTILQAMTQLQKLTVKYISWSSTTTKSSFFLKLINWWYFCSIERMIPLERIVSTDWHK
jgi:hypothetical protein